MTSSIARKNITFLISKHPLPPVCRSPFAFSVYLQFLSTSTEIKHDICPALLDNLVVQHQFPPEWASRVATELTRLKNPERAVSILSFFKQSGFSPTQLEGIVKYGPRFLACKLEDTIKPKFKVLQDMGISSGDVCMILSRTPSILELSVKNIVHSMSILKDLLGSSTEAARVVRITPRILAANLNKTLLPNVEFVKSCGIPMERIRIILTGYPGSLIVKPEVLREFVENAKEMGLDASSNSFIYAIPFVSKMTKEAWELKFHALQDLGFSDSDILTIFRKEPRALYGSMEKIKKVKELLLATGKFNISSIVNFPRSLLSSIEKKYVPRLRILGILESRNLIKEWPSLGYICVLTDDQFSDRFVRPHLDEVSDLYITKNS